MEHTTMTGECRQMFQRLEEKIDGLTARMDRINGRYEKHLEEGVIYRAKVDEHALLLSLIEKEKLNSVKASQWRIAIIVSVITSVLTILSRILIK